MPGSRATRSVCTAVTEQGWHSFDISGYSVHKHTGGTDFFIPSCTFSVGGHDWSIHFHPNVVSDAGDGAFQHYIAVFLVLLSKRAKVMASCDLGLLDHTTGQPTSVHRTPEPIQFRYGDRSNCFPQHAFMDHAALEASPYLKEDRLVICCDVTVIKEPRVFSNVFVGELEPPPSNIAGELGKLLGTGVGTDVTFVVKEVTFAAHKIILAVRSPVFMAQFYGPMREATMQYLVVEDMLPAVFDAMLHFIYNDDLPDTEELTGDPDNKMIQHLLVAADRYDVARLKLVCQSILCDKLDVQNVSTTLILAYHHSCPKLRNFCVRLITDPDHREAVKATAGYRDLKTNNPEILADLFEMNTNNLHKK